MTFRAKEKEAGRRKNVLFRSAHLAARLDGAEFRDHIVKVVQVLVKVKDYLRESSIQTVPCISSSHLKTPVKNKPLQTQCSLLIATHSFTSTYLGGATIVLKLPLTRAALTNG
jgi:hypothetical protein